MLSVGHSISKKNRLPKVVRLFFFSSRRRHTRSYGDWSSDVCSSDLASFKKHRPEDGVAPKKINATVAKRSEERRVGKECRSGRAADPLKKRDRARHVVLSGCRRRWRGSRCSSHAVRRLLAVRFDLRA